MIKQKQVLNELESDLKVLRYPEFGKLVSYSPTSKLPIHRWFKYREGYSVNLIDYIIEERKEKVVLDPFCGSGTSLLSSKLHNVESTGIDINPVSTFIATVKTQYYEKNDIENIKNALKCIERKGASKELGKPKLSIIDKAFNNQILLALLGLKEKIKRIEDSKIRNFLLLAYLSILERVSNTYKEGNGIKYKFTKRTKHGYIHIPQERWETENLPHNKIKFTYEVFAEKVTEMLEDLKILIGNNTPTKIHNHDATKLTQIVDKGVSLCVFSPPYCNCFDYFEIFKIELWMGEFVKDYLELKEKRRKSIRSNTNADLTRSYEKIDFIEKIVEIIPHSKLWSEKVKSVIRGYFSDMASALREIFKVLEKDGRCVIIVGNSAYGGVLIPTDLLLAKIGEEIGFTVDCIKVARHLTTSSQQKKSLKPVERYLRESLVCLSGGADG